MREQYQRKGLGTYQLNTEVSDIMLRDRGFKSTYGRRYFLPHLMPEVLVSCFQNGLCMLNAFV